MTDKPSSLPSDDEIDLGRLFGLLLDHKWLIVAITALFSLGGVAYALLATPIYQADALVQVESKTGMANPLQDMRAMLGDESSPAAELGIIRSRMVLGQAVDRLQLDLKVVPNRLPVVGDFLVRQGVSRPDIDALQSIVWSGETIEVRRFQPDSTLVGQPVTLIVEDPSHYRLILDEQSLGKGRVGEMVSFLDGRLEVQIDRIDAAPGARFTIARQPRLAAINNLRARFQVSQQGNDSGLFNLTLNDSDPHRAKQTLSAIADVYLQQNIQRQAAEAEKSLEFLEQQIPKVRQELQGAENRLNAYRAQRESVDLSQETSTMLERLVRLESQINELEFTESEISRRFTPSHPTYAALLDKKQQLRKERERLEARINELPETQQEILRMRRDVEVNQQVYVQLLNKAQEMSIARASTVGNVRILDDALVSPAPVEPKKPLIVVLATLLGGMLGTGVVLARGLLNRGVESPEQIEDAGLAVYATIPLSEEQQKLLTRVKRSKERTAQTISTGVLAERAPADTAVEALRGLRTSLHFAMLESTNNLLSITGPSPSIGKSFVSYNLGAVCAQAGQKVLVVDADMRKGHIHQAFEGKGKDGLSELISGKLMLDDVVRTSRIDGLDYMSRGTPPPNPSELLMHVRFSEFLEEASRRYDLVIIDTPPILAVTDAAVVSKQCGTTLMVVRFQKNPAKELQIAVRRLETAGVNPQGAILNAIERKAATSYGYGYYNYSYK